MTYNRWSKLFGHSLASFPASRSPSILLTRPAHSDASDCKLSMARTPSTFLCSSLLVLPGLSNVRSTYRWMETLRVGLFVLMSCSFVCPPLLPCIRCYRKSTLVHIGWLDLSGLSGWIVRDVVDHVSFSIPSWHCLTFKDESSSIPRHFCTVDV